MALPSRFALQVACSDKSICEHMLDFVNLIHHTPEQSQHTMGNESTDETVVSLVWAWPGPIGPSKPVPGRPGPWPTQAPALGPPQAAVAPPTLVFTWTGTSQPLSTLCACETRRSPRPCIAICADCGGAISTPCIKWGG